MRSVSRVCSIPGRRGLLRQPWHAAAGMLCRRGAGARHTPPRRVGMVTGTPLRRDLLGKEPQEKLEIKLCPDGSGQLYVPGLTEFRVQSVEDINKVRGDGASGESRRVAPGL